MMKLPSPRKYGLIPAALPVTASLRAAIDCGDDGLRYTGISWNAERRTALVYDGQAEREGDAVGLRIYVDHPACRRSPARQLKGRAWLVFDWERRLAWLGPEKQARRFLEDCWLALFADADVPEQAERELRAAAENIADQLLAQPEALRAALDAYRPPSPLKWHVRLRLELDLLLRLS